MTETVPAVTTFQTGLWTRMEDDGFVGLVGPIYEWNGASETGRFGFLSEDKHRNRGGYVQGGMLMTFADRAMGATARKDDPGRVQATVQLDVHFIRPARIGVPIEIETRVIRETRKLAFIEGTLTSEGDIIARANGVWSILRRS
ncbi:PaaI family thioesterase [Pseudochelatococcus sp. B33]